MFKNLLIAALFLGSVTLKAPIAHATSLADHAKLVCHSYLRLTEQQAEIPTQLLESIALTESAKWYEPLNRTIAWPWTVMAEGKERYFETKQEAINEVLKLRSKDVRNIEVGCMQINLMHHPDAFASLEEAFDPQTNVRYSAKLLLDLKSRFATWSNAVGYYHSATPELHFQYRQKVLNKWRETRQQKPIGVAIAPYAVADNTPFDYTPRNEPLGKHIVGLFVGLLVIAGLSAILWLIFPILTSFLTWQIAGGIVIGALILGALSSR